MNFATPPSVVPDWIRELIPRGSEEVPEAAERLQGASFDASGPPAYMKSAEASIGAKPTEYVLPAFVPDVTRPSAPVSYALPAPGLDVESPQLPPSYHAPELLPVPSAEIESPRFSLTTSETSPTYRKEVQSHYNSASRIVETLNAVRYLRPIFIHSIWLMCFGSTSRLLRRATLRRAQVRRNNP